MLQAPDRAWSRYKCDGVKNNLLDTEEFELLFTDPDQHKVVDRLLGKTATCAIVQAKLILPSPHIVQRIILYLWGIRNVQRSTGHYQC